MQIPFTSTTGTCLVIKCWKPVVRNLSSFQTFKWKPMELDAISFISSGVTHCIVLAYDKSS